MVEEAHMSHVILNVTVSHCDIPHDQLAGRIKEILESALNTNPVTEVEVDVRAIEPLLHEAYRAAALDHPVLSDRQSPNKENKQ